jgi:hypothetical protein
MSAEARAKDFDTPRGQGQGKHLRAAQKKSFISLASFSNPTDHAKVMIVHQNDIVLCLVSEQLYSRTGRPCTVVTAAPALGCSGCYDGLVPASTCITVIVFRNMYVTSAMRQTLAALLQVEAPQ